ncbi:MAG TPA: sulfatase-like hydrolase/transferase [Sedimentisphaerales bacterium]|nr:sulfatase-like hydrolase/transferase [Sedimentisphaerales bacterium]
MHKTCSTRRDFLKSVGAGAAAVSLAGCMGSLANLAGKAPRPNIIFIMADDLGYGDLGCYGQKLIRTPSVDRMAAEGMRFTQCYAGACVCAPSRSVLITGQHTGHTRVRENKCRVGGVPDEMTGGGCRLPLKDEDVTVAEVLKQAGYATGITGKWGLGDPGTTGVPNLQGFDEWFGYLNQNHAVFYYTDYLWRNGQKVFIDGNRDGRRQQYSQDLFTDFALDFIRRHHKKPFFLYVPYTIPHFNLEVPSIEPYGDKPWPEKAKIFAAMITRMDRDVGHILDLLKELGIDNNTITFFCSDNGAAGAGGPLFNSSGPLKGGKGGFNEGGIRTPMVVRWPGRVQAGKVSDAQWYYADVMPTLAELAGVGPPANIDGTSVVPALLTGKQRSLSERFMYWESPPPQLQQVVRWRNWKARRRKPGLPLELYDLSEDLREEHDVAARHPEVVTVFEEYLRTARTDSPNWPMES